MIAPESIPVAPSAMFAFDLADAWRIVGRVSLPKAEAQDFARWLVARFAGRDMRDMVRLGANDLFWTYREELADEALAAARAACEVHTAVHERHTQGLATDGELRRSMDRCDMLADRAEIMVARSRP